MTWTDQQWTTFCALIEEWWPGEFDEAARGAWRVALDGTDPAAASECAQRLLLRGHRFRPSASEFLAELRHDPSQPTFDEAVALIYRAGCFYGPERLDFLRERAPLVAAFVERQGVDRIFTLELDDPEYGELKRRELRDAWTVHVEAFDGREVAAIASGSGDLKRLDPLASIPRLGA